MKKALALLFIAIGFSGFAQKSTAFTEIGGFAGTYNYLGDVNGNNLSAFTREVRGNVGLYLKRNYNSVMSFGVEANYGSVYSHDKFHGNADRSYIVDTDIFQFNGFTNIHFKRFGKYYKRNPHSPFIHMGAGALVYTPHLDVNAEYPDGVNLYPGTDFGINYTLGFGWRFRHKTKTFVNWGVYYQGTNVTNLEGFDFEQDPTSSTYVPQRFDGMLVMRFGMSLGFFDQ